MTISEPEEIRPTGRVFGKVRPPGSKSLTNRAMICAALAHGKSLLSGALDSEDTRVMCSGLSRLGIPIVTRNNRTEIEVAGKSGVIPVSSAELDCANSGTTIRFLTALTSVGKGSYRLDGVERMRQRPIDDLLEALNRLGAQTISLGDGVCPPVRVEANGLQGGAVSIRGNISSQFLSGLLMVAPYAKGTIVIDIDGPLVSRPYVEMTCQVMRSFGVSIDVDDDATRFAIDAPRKYQGCDFAVEPDASAASYFWATAAVTGGDVTVLGLFDDAIQGDVRFCDCLAQMGCEVRHEADGIRVIGGPIRGIDVDMNDISDTVQTLAVVALFANGPTTIRGVAHNRHKETDRIGDLARELRKLGAGVTELHDGLTINPGEYRAALIETYNDHRMAMSLSLAGLRIPKIRIANPACTIKTYPNFFADLRRLIGQR